jgi:trk system potassium uptake protein TrkH
LVRPLPVLYVLGPVIMMFGGLMLLPLAVGHFLADAASRAYDFSVVLTIALGALLWLLARRSRVELQPQHGFLLVALTWTALPALATVPLMLGVPGLSFTDAYFETSSAMTTTGATVLTGLDFLPPSINVWRALLQWIGGMGVVVLAVAILPMLRVGGREVFKAETPGPMKDQKLTPRLAQTAKGLWTVYIVLTAACVLAYRWGGMSWIDAVIHAFTTMSLGGYSSHDASFAFFDSPLLEAIAVVFMVAAGINFGTHFMALHGRTLAPYRRDPEVLAFLAVLAASCAGIALFLLNAGVYGDAATAARHATFNVVSIATTTGYASTDYALWPLFAPLWMLTLCCFASCSGSTGGGIKMIRAQLLVLHTGALLKQLVHPRAFIPVKLGAMQVGTPVILGMLGFLMVFAGTLLVAVLVLVATGLDFVGSLTGAIACITNTGPGLGSVGPAGNYAALTDLQKWVLAATMLLGRLELFTLLVVFSPAFWKR